MAYILDPEVLLEALLAVLQVLPAPAAVVVVKDTRMVACMEKTATTAAQEM